MKRRQQEATDGVGLNSEEVDSPGVQPAARPVRLLVFAVISQLKVLVVHRMCVSPACHDLALPTSGQRIRELIAEILQYPLARRVSTM